jgi:TonB family protein
MERGIAVRRIVDGREVVLITRKGADGKETVTVVGSSKNDAVDEAKALLRKEGVQQLNVKNESANDNDSIYNVVSENAEFPGGDVALSDWMRKNMKYPEECRKQGIQGRVVISFVVNKDGSIVDLETVRSPHPALAEEGLRVVKSMPKWEPAKENGKVVRSRFNIPIMFWLDGGKKTQYTSPQKPQSPQSLTDEQKAVHDWFGAQPELMTHLNKNIRYPKECQEQGFEGRVLVSIAVEKDGSVSVDGSEYKPVSSKNDTPVAVNAYKNADGTQKAKLSEEELKNLMIKEAERVLKLSPKLKPYKNGKGETVRATFKVPVMFRLH